MADLVLWLHGDGESDSDGDVLTLTNGLICNLDGPRIIPSTTTIIITSN